MKKHCKTCKCGIKMIRHTCWNCKTKKLEKYMVLKGGTIVGWGHGGHWFCVDKEACKENPNYA